MGVPWVRDHGSVHVRRNARRLVVRKGRVQLVSGDAANWAGDQHVPRRLGHLFPAGRAVVAEEHLHLLGRRAPARCLPVKREVAVQHELAPVPGELLHDDRARERGGVLALVVVGAGRVEAQGVCAPEGGRPAVEGARAGVDRDEGAVRLRDVLLRRPRPGDRVPRVDGHGRRRPLWSRAVELDNAHGGAGLKTQALAMHARLRGRADVRVARRLHLEDGARVAHEPEAGRVVLQGHAPGRLVFAEYKITNPCGAIDVDANRRARRGRGNGGGSQPAACGRVGQCRRARFELERGQSGTVEARRRRRGAHTERLARGGRLERAHARGEVLEREHLPHARRGEREDEEPHLLELRVAP
mmetsp:Transcript_7316/g.17531  ORF Transcript_7316/g.17531 Transcript_7316/m.17531 type:complete len:357 (+) Transcript_7316:430-1500(+)